MASPSRPPYVARSWDLHGLQGLSDRTLELHFQLYAGYVHECNQLEVQLARCRKPGRPGRDAQPDREGLLRRLGFEQGGRVLHELYFDNLTRKGRREPKGSSAFRRAAAAAFGSYAAWRADLIGVGGVRGVGWALCCLDPASGRLSNHWVSEHHVGAVAGFLPVVAIDVWEHAFLLDYAPSERGEYLEACVSNLDWTVIERRLQAGRRPGFGPPRS